MTADDDFAFAAAATLALDLSSEFPDASDETLATAAWHAFKEQEAPESAKFMSTDYVRHVKAAMDHLRKTPLGRVEHSPALLNKASAHL